MLFYYYLIVVAISLILIGTYIFLKNKISNKTQLILKIISLTLVCVFFVRYMSRQESLMGIIKLQSDLFKNTFFAFLSLVCVWFMYANILVLTLYPFFKVKYLDLFVKFFCAFIVALNFVALPLALTGVDGSKIYTQITFRSVLMCLELGISIFYVFYVWFNNHSFKCTKKELLMFFLSVFSMLLATMPAYAFEFLFGYVNPNAEIDELTLWHRIYLYFALIIPLVIYFALRKKDEQTIKFSLLYLSLGALVTFMCGSKFASWLNPTQWPIHLCHTAMYIIPLCLIFKWKKLFYFTFFINVLGAFLAMIMPNTSGNMFSYAIIRFWNNHYMAFFMPILCVALNVYERPKLKEFIYSATAFTVYFVLIMFINAWFSNYGTVDFFFINSDFIAEKLGRWAEDLRDFTWTFYIGKLKFVLYPLYQFLFWLVYIIASAGMWFLYEQSYVYVDLMIDMAQRRKKYKLDMLALQVKLNGKEITKPMNEQNSNKLILRNFTKRYGKSEVYAVKDVNLEVHGGEIFGFLGPNGAGKSTIIKTIVGIQPITSGEIEICGYDAKLQSTMAKRQIGFVPDHYALYEKLTGREYINYIADLYEVSKEDRDKRIEKYVNLFELSGAFDNQIKTYSHGMKQKIAIMSALVHNPKLWILDEPLTGLDPNSIFQVKECMKNHAKEGNIVFFSSHIIDVVERICDRIGIIKKGQLQTVKSVKEILDSNEPLEDFYMNIINNSDVEAIKVDSEQLKLDKLEKNEEKNQKHLKKQRMREKKLQEKELKKQKNKKN